MFERSEFSTFPEAVAVEREPRKGPTGGGLLLGPFLGRQEKALVWPDETGRF